MSNPLGPEFGQPRRDESSDEFGAFFTALLTPVVAFLLFLIVPVLLAAALFYALRRVLQRRDWAILLLAGLAGFALYARDNAYGYGYWMASFAGLGPGSPREVPVTALLCMAAAMAGCAGLIFGQAIGSPVSALSSLLRLKKKIMDVLDGAWFRRKEMVDDGLTPRQGRREMLRKRVEKRVPLSLVPAVRGPYATEKARQTPLKAKAVPLGLGSRDRPVWLSVQEMGMHGAVVGSTGSGKTVTLMWLIGAALDMGYDVTVLDLKEDTQPGGLRDFVRAYGRMHRVPLQEIALADEQPAFWFNVLDGMSPDEAFDTVMTLVEFDDAYWQALNRKILQQVVQLGHQAAEVAPSRFHPPTMLELGKIMEHGARMRDAVRDRVQVVDAVHGTGYCLQRYTNVLRPSADEGKSAASFGTKLTGLYDSSAGRRILVGGEGRRAIDVRQGGLTYIGLNSLGQPDMAKILSSSALQRLSVYAAQRIQGRAPKDRPRLIVVDEANFIHREIAMNMLARVRGALFSMILCTQGPTDWIDKDGDDWSRLTQNINWLVAMAQSSPESAEKCADFLGMRDNGKFSERVGEHGHPLAYQTMDEEEYVVDPKELRDLGTGEAYLRVNKPRSRVEYVVMPMRRQELDRYSPPDPYDLPGRHELTAAAMRPPPQRRAPE
ncbi:helicase HerA-like domain-containing protein [Actinomadura sp. B10D3]|uniref:type IV secretory system conjugative DNA transfer family protein n=1 Tax=Actinomadura sp. B10D3 TaxID=3153557 RepID=UPI00325EA8A3